MRYKLGLALVLVVAASLTLVTTTSSTRTTTSATLLAASVPVTKMTTSSVPNDIGKPTASVVAEAKRVHTDADLAKVSPAAKHLIQTMVSETSTVIVTPVAKITLMSTQSPGRGCWSVVDAQYGRNALGWVLASATVPVNNWCNDGNRTITTTPWYQTIQNTHWGWTFCGLTNGYSGWFVYPWLWGAGATFSYDPGVCAPWKQLVMSPEIQVYGNGTWWGS